MAGPNPALCEAIEALPKRQRKTIVMIVLNNGYATKDVAEMMGVSPSAVSRYMHDDLAPSTQAICRLIHSLDDETLLQVTSYIVEELWGLIASILRTTPVSSAIIERIADEVAKIIIEKTEKT